MATNSTEVVNLALARIGQDTINDIANTELPDAVLMNAIYTGTVYEVLSIMPWNCAIKRAKLDLNAEENLSQYENAYDLPDDLIRILDIDGEKEKIYRIEGTRLLTDEGDGDPLSAKIRYISKLDDPALWDEILTETIVLRLAEKASLKITQNIELTSYLQSNVITELTIAQQSAASEDREDISNIISQLNNAKIADIVLARNNYAAG